MRFLSVGSMIAALLCPVPALAQSSYPSKPVRVIVPLTPGAGMGLIMRKAGEELQSRLGQPLVVDHQPGGNFVVGALACARASADGYTLCTMTGDATSLNPHLYANLPYDPERDFKGVTNLYYLTGGLFVKSSLGVDSLDELRSLAAAKSGGLNWGTLGPDSTTDMARQWMAERWGTRIAGIPYKGGAPVFAALGTGEIDLAWIGVYNGQGLLKAGRIKLLAVGSLKRSPLVPSVPTLGELGLGDLPAARTWWALFVPKATPDAMVKRMNNEFVRLFREPRFVEFMDSEYTEIAVGTPEELDALVRADRERLGELVRKYKLPRR